MNGNIHVGLSAKELRDLAESVTPEKRNFVRKCSRRDLPITLAKNENGATTVAGTMIISQLCGIDFFVTGGEDFLFFWQNQQNLLKIHKKTGIGGVHKGAEQTFDISADLTGLFIAFFFGKNHKFHYFSHKNRIGKIFDVCYLCWLQIYS